MGPKARQKITNSYQDWRVEGDCCFAVGTLDPNFISMKMESPHEKPNAVVPQCYLLHGFNRNLQRPESPKKIQLINIESSFTRN